MVTADVIAWLEGLDLGRPVPVYQGPTGPDAEPREHLVVSPVAGGRLTTEGLLEQYVYQVKTVGPQGATARSLNAVAAVAERLAKAVDRELLNAVRPVMGTAQVISISRFGGGPTGQPRDAGKRYPFTATYMVEAESEIY